MPGTFCLLLPAARSSSSSAMSVCQCVCVCVYVRTCVCVCVCSSMDLYDTWYVSAYVFVSHSLRTEIRINTGSGARAGAQLLR